MPSPVARSSRKKRPLKITLPGKGWTVFHFSHNTVFTLFLSMSFFVAALLYGATLGVSRVAVAHVEIPNQHAVLENHMRELVSGFPIEKMASIIAKQNKTTAAFLVGIAKKESNWGKRVPRSDDGKDCYNYWGYRGAGSRGIAMGHGCFGSPEEAIGIVGGRLDTLAREYQFDTAEELIVWKCGWSCDGHSSVSVKKWIADVGYYKRQMENPSPF